MNARTIEFDKFVAQLQRCDVEMARLEEKVGHQEPERRGALENEAHDTLQAMLDKELATLRHLWDEADQALRMLEQAKDDEWEILKARVEQALTHLDEALKESHARFGE